MILDGIVVGSLALIAVVAWQLARSAIVDRFTLVISRFSLVALVLQTSSARLILAAAILGWITKAHQSGALPLRTHAKLRHKIK